MEARNGGEDAAEHGEVGPSEDVGAVDEEGAGDLEVDFLSDDVQQRLQELAQQREALQQVEIELRAQVIAHPQVVKARRSLKAAVKGHVAAAAELKELLQEREKYNIELEMKLNEKDRQLAALKIVHEKAWANQDLLIEQNKELATFRREQENSEAERGQHLKQIHDLQEHLREKENQFLALEQQLREAQSWIAQVEKMDTLQSQSLQALLEKRTQEFDKILKGFLQQGESGIPSPLLGNGGFLPSGQMTGMHPYMRHPQGVPQPLTSSNSAVPHFGHFQPPSITQSNQQWPNQQEAPDASQVCDQTNFQPPKSDQSALQAGVNYDDEHSAQQRQILCSEHFLAHGQHQQSCVAAIVKSSHELKVVESNVTESLVQEEQHKALKEHHVLTSSVNNSTVKFEQQEQKVEPKYAKIAAGNQPKEKVPGQQHKTANLAAATLQSHPKNSATELSSSVVNQVDALTSAGGGSSPLLPRIPKEPAPLDERSLLACIVRAVLAGPDGRIKISSTLPNRLGKMLAPLHWRDYRKCYGKLDDLVANHPELFVIEGDFIHLREGEQHILPATTAAAAESSTPYSSLLPSVAVTPVAQSIWQRRGPVVDSRSASTTSFGNGSPTNSGDQLDKCSQIPKANYQHQNVGFNIVQGAGDMTIEQNDFSAEIHPGQSSAHAAVANDGRYERASLPMHEKGTSNGRHGHVKSNRGDLQGVHKFPEDD